ncbi:MAG: hypothetical protein D6820_10020 [Lentisphaerae bacterium]|nr:MAG: hypothetical protein D6820_10020 [Lentisphaerota bacterium]
MSIKVSSLFTLLTCIFLFATSNAARSRTKLVNVLAQGEFEPAGEYGIPWGWTLPVWDARRISVLTPKKGIRVLQIKHDSAGENTVLSTSITLKPVWKKVMFQAYARFIRKDKKNEPAGGIELVNGPGAIPIPADGKWTKIQKIWEVTEEKPLIIRIGLWEAAGVMQVTRMKLIPAVPKNIPGPEKPLEFKSNYGVPADWKIVTRVKDWNRVALLRTPKIGYILRIKQTKPDTFYLERTVNISPNWKRIRVSMEVQTLGLERTGQGFETARVEIRKNNEKKDLLACFGVYKSDDKWKRFVKEFENKDAAESFILRVGFWKTAGTFALRKITIQPLEFADND